MGFKVPYCRACKEAVEEWMRVTDKARAEKGVYGSNSPPEWDFGRVEDGWYDGEWGRYRFCVAVSEVWCTCPDFQVRGKVCKHLVAVGEILANGFMERKLVLTMVRIGLR